MTDKNVYFTTLGCSKNDVDTDVMRTILEKKNYNSVYSPDMADIIVINTCGFIESAKEESINEIFEMTQYKSQGDKKILVSGCLAQRYSNELLEQIPEIDGILGTGQIKNIEQYIAQLELGNKVNETGDIDADIEEGIFKTNANVSEYVKIGEGCNNFCSYCIIPKLRGRNRSRKIENIYKEVENLAKRGTREVILIAQNTTDYGIDNYGEHSLAKLVNKLEEIEELKWIRVLYLYPDNFTDNLIESFKNNKKLLPYVDIPLQHVNDEVLKNMNRSTNKKDIISLIDKLRKEIPNIIIRSTFIIGFPGETNEQFMELVDFLKEMKLDRVGVFEYSREEDTIAYNFDNQIDKKTKSDRKDYIMNVQEKISFENMEGHLGQILEVLVEEINDDVIVGRSYMDSPEIDGVVYINTDEKVDNINIGEFVYVKIIDVMEHDMIGELYEFSK